MFAFGWTSVTATLCVKDSFVQRRILIGGTGLVKGRVKSIGSCMLNVCDELEPELNKMKWSDSAPFYTLSLIILYGENDSRAVEIGSINRRYKELNVSIETSLSNLKSLENNGGLQGFIMELAKTTIDAVSYKYDLCHIST